MKAAYALIAQQIRGLESMGIRRNKKSHTGLRGGKSFALWQKGKDFLFIAAG
jgi:hypothetical protein